MCAFFVFICDFAEKVVDGVKKHVHRLLVGTLGRLPRVIYSWAHDIGLCVQQTHACFAYNLPPACLYYSDSLLQRGIKRIRYFPTNTQYLARPLQGYARRWVLNRQSSGLPRFGTIDPPILLGILSFPRCYSRLFPPP